MRAYFIIIVLLFTIPANIEEALSGPNKKMWK